MRPASLVSVAAVLVLAACGDSAVETPSALEDATESVDEGPTPLPGQYSTTTELLELSIPGISPEMRQMFEQVMAEGAQAGASYCLTAAETANAREEMLRSLTESDCTVQRLDVSGGNIDAALSCPSGTEGITGDVSMTGTMSETGANITMTFKTQVPNAGEATIRMRAVSQRTGDCV
ncbi:MAG: DUF3617 domain-containing protein [Alteraurantiacibacter sp.]|nr:DUF3617 domain-containing protein [Alteraurantiacibacter sp.]